MSEQEFGYYAMFELLLVLVLRGYDLEQAAGLLEAGRWPG